MYSGVGAASLRLLMYTHAHTRLRTVVVRPTKTVHVYKRVCHALACLCYVWKRLQPECVCFHIVNACLCSSSEINNNFWYCVSLRFVHCFCWSKGNCVLVTSLFLLTVNFRVSGTIFYKFVRRFDQDVQRCQSGFITPTHIHTHTHTRPHTPQDGCRSPNEDCARLQEGLSRLGTFVLRLETVATRMCMFSYICTIFICFLNKSTISKFNKFSTAWVKCKL